MAKRARKPWCGVFLVEGKRDGLWGGTFRTCSFGLGVSGTLGGADLSGGVSCAGCRKFTVAQAWFGA